MESREDLLFVARRRYDGVVSDAVAALRKAAAKQRDLLADVLAEHELIASGRHKLLRRLEAAHAEAAAPLSELGAVATAPALAVSVDLAAAELSAQLDDETAMFRHRIAALVATRKALAAQAHEVKHPPSIDTLFAHLLRMRSFEDRLPIRAHTAELAIVSSRQRPLVTSEQALQMAQMVAMDQWGSPDDDSSAHNLESLSAMVAVKVELKKRAKEIVKLTAKATERLQKYLDKAAAAQEAAAAAIKPGAAASAKEVRELRVRSRELTEKAAAKQARFDALMESFRVELLPLQEFEEPEEGKGGADSQGRVGGGPGGGRRRRRSKRAKTPKSRPGRRKSRPNKRRAGSGSTNLKSPHGGGDTAGGVTIKVSHVMSPGMSAGNSTAGLAALGSASHFDTSSGAVTGKAGGAAASSGRGVQARALPRSGVVGAATINRRTGETLLSMPFRVPREDLPPPPGLTEAWMRPNELRFKRIKQPLPVGVRGAAAALVPPKPAQPRSTTRIRRSESANSALYSGAGSSSPQNFGGAGIMLSSLEGGSSSADLGVFSADASSLYRASPAGSTTVLGGRVAVRVNAPSSPPHAANGHGASGAPRVGAAQRLAKTPAPRRGGHGGVSPSLASNSDGLGSYSASAGHTRPKRRTGGGRGQQAPVTMFVGRV